MHTAAARTSSKRPHTLQMENNLCVFHFHFKLLLTVLNDITHFSLTFLNAILYYISIFPSFYSLSLINTHLFIYETCTYIDSARTPTQKATQEALRSALFSEKL